MNLLHIIDQPLSSLTWCRETKSRLSIKSKPRRFYWSYTCSCNSHAVFKSKTPSTLSVKLTLWVIPGRPYLKHICSEYGSLQCRNIKNRQSNEYFMFLKQKMYKEKMGKHFFKAWMSGRIQKWNLSLNMRQCMDNMVVKRQVYTDSFCLHPCWQWLLWWKYIL